MAGMRTLFFRLCIRVIDMLLMWCWLQWMSLCLVDRHHINVFYLANRYNRIVSCLVDRHQRNVSCLADKHHMRVSYVFDRLHMNTYVYLTDITFLCCNTEGLKGIIQAVILLIPAAWWEWKSLELENVTRKKKKPPRY